MLVPISFFKTWIPIITFALCMSNASIKFAKKVSSMKTEHFKYFSVPLFRVTCVLQNLPEVDVCKSFIPTILLGTESFTKTAG